MPTRVNSVGIPRTAASTYERELRRMLLYPAISHLRRRLGELVERGVVSPLEVERRIAEVIAWLDSEVARTAAIAAEGHVVRTASGTGGESLRRSGRLAWTSNR